jgi:hypothetical protein
MGMREDDGRLHTPPTGGTEGGTDSGARGSRSSTPTRPEDRGADMRRQSEHVDQRDAERRMEHSGATALGDTGYTDTMRRDEGITARRDRVRWGPVWTGVVVAIGVYLLLQLMLVATGAIDLGVAETADAWWTAAAALIAFFIGGLTTGASAIWDRIEDGILHGVVLWAVSIVALLVLSAAAGGLALGALDATGAFDAVTVDLEEGTIEGIETAIGAEDAEQAASWVLLGLTAALIAAVLGGIAGAKLWPRTEDVEVERSGTTARG